ncbi:MAG TPA: transcriptional initiation protein Tat [Candidatus Bathyarchaeota archaeon]|nr:transcriptional initiation protein Tat [Candidatus Bathyarchaeota archaeon]
MELEVSIVKIPPTDSFNDFYVGNRPPLIPNPLLKLPVGSITPRGWLHTQLKLSAEGLVGHLPELSKFCDFERSAWANPDGKGEYGWEELPYWLRGFISLGYILKDERIISEGERWIKAVLESQDSDGYFGPRINKENVDLWPNMIMLDAIRTYYEARGDERVLSLMRKYFQWQLSIPEEKLFPGRGKIVDPKGLLHWQALRGGDNLESIYWLYNHTGEEWLLKLAERIHIHTYDWKNWHVKFRRGDLFTKEHEWSVDLHGVNICQGFREPAQFYQQSWDASDLEASEENYKAVMDVFGQVPGGMFGADENCREGFIDPRQGAETCSMVEFMRSMEILIRITGEVKYADRCEDIAFNSFPASMTPDLKALHYLTSPNMIRLDQRNKAPLIQNPGDMFTYNPYGYRCCQHNVSQGWPYFVEHLWMATRDNGLSAVLYAPSSVRARVGEGETIEIQEITDYPFSEVIEFHMRVEGSVYFPLYLRVPGWCKEAELYVNGEKQDVPLKSFCYIKVSKNWEDGDIVKLYLPMELKIIRWIKNKDSISVYRGPLAYSLYIKERWVKYGGSEKWPAYEVHPETPWNYGLILGSRPEDSFRVVKRGEKLAEQPFRPENAPIILVAKAKIVLDWREEENGLVGELPHSPVKVEGVVEEIRLIPMGAARLRISSFPQVLDP